MARAPHPPSSVAPAPAPAPRRPRAAPGPATPRHNISESPLTWLARRSGRDGRPLVDAAQLAAGERLRADFTRAQLTPRVTSRWEPTPGGGSGGPEAFTDMVLAAKSRFDKAMAAVGPELSGVLLDVCCFLKGLEEVERDRRWPARTAKVVLGLALDRLAAHYGLSATARGRDRAPLRGWQAPADTPAAPEPGP
ncbi:DUF6456 domain-containing protein [Xanthobacter sp. V4C-4]|uniref:DUF6456 domain-containing protein n=1 Tax=Xanthobacter cornucopiae TaxID=3119924 RepID=UPI00372CB3FC